MRTSQAVTDKLAIYLSMACAFHCLALPVLLVALPSIVATTLDNEAFHFWMVMAVVPSSIYALSLGCKQHKRYSFMIYGVIGLALLILAVSLGEERMTEIGEKMLTLIGASFVAVGHWFNYRLCNAQKNDDKACACPSQNH